MAQSLTFLIFGRLGLMLLVVGCTRFAQQRRNLAHAQRVEATITHSQVFSSTAAAPFVGNVARAVDGQPKTLPRERTKETRLTAP